MLFVGLTGGLGSGKSEALAAFERLGAPTLSSDAVVHELLGTERVRDLLVDRWPHDDTVLRAYPAFAEAGERVAGPPDWWSETA